MRTNGTGRGFAFLGAVALLCTLVPAAPAWPANFAGDLCFSVVPGPPLLRMHVKPVDAATFVVTSPLGLTGIATKVGSAIILNLDSNTIEEGDRKSMFMRVNLSAPKLSGTYWYQMLKSHVAGGGLAHSSGSGTVRLRPCP